MVSIVCPFYNEASILEASVHLMLRNLQTLSDDWELIIVNDGSTDDSLAIARQLEEECPHLRVLSYPDNRGRGYAIRAGTEAARGDILVTTEIDCSWGDDIVLRLVAEFRKRPDADMIIASPHLPGGGYKNVPARRVFLSSFGNYVIRSGLTYQITMNTGMTRAYRREKFLLLPLDESGKELHLEIVQKAVAFGYRIYEIPAVLEWKDHKLSRTPGLRRKSSSNINRLIQTHVVFSLLAAPFRYIYALAGLLGAAAVGCFVWAVYRLLTHQVSVYELLLSSVLALFSFLVFGVGVLAQQGRSLQRDLWRIRSALETGEPHQDFPSESRRERASEHNSI
jgi:glycosyltransferase involved in cell wall biosynthesis